MRIVDTSARIEWPRDSSAGADIAGLLPSQDAWIVPTIVQLELAKWITREVGEEKTEQVITFTENCRVVDLGTELALAAAETSSRLRLAGANAIIYATASVCGVEVMA